MWLQDECLLALILGGETPPPTPPPHQKKLKKRQWFVVRVAASRLSILSKLIYLFTGRWLLAAGLHKVFLMLAFDTG